MNHGAQTTRALSKSSHMASPIGTKQNLGLVSIAESAVSATDGPTPAVHEKIPGLQVDGWRRLLVAKGSCDAD